MGSSLRDVPPLPDAPTPELQFTPQVIFKFAGGVMLATAALYYLAKGREDKDLGKMLTGGVLAVLSVLLFAI